ncbi:hypothetical protein LGQ02_10165 [Bacillus shivajii]|uniref:hypothetical protein n=1 Tax=Bacillus shivajii TaxID=1983719 RepID=UPI001CF9FB00|nr:hypothetical protein [Bacillus shivajii]UCZ55057.1 hypothetical protein LGQ02_10165 [Bacillus shivajii]
MKKSLWFVSLLIFTLWLVGCNSQNLELFETMEEAVTFGLEKEGSDKNALLSVEEYKGETLVFYELDDSLGVSSITKSEEGFNFFKNTSYVRFGEENAHYIIGFEFETKSGVKIPILAGKANDEDIQKIIVLEGGIEKELNISKNSRLFYTMYEEPFDSLDVIPIYQ